MPFCPRNSGGSLGAGGGVRFMQNLHAQRGFSLAELAVTIVIAGILVGAGLAAQSWVENARVTATVSQVTAYTNAVSQFRKMYVATPGDMYKAGLRLPGCPGVNGAACNPVETPSFPGFPYFDGPNPAVISGTNPVGANGNPTATTMDGIVGPWAWNATWGAPASTSTGGLTGAASVDDERYLFWAHLLLSGLISGVTAEGLHAAVPLQLSITNPALPTGGGLIAGYGLAATSPAITPKGPGSTQTTAGLSGLILVQVVDPRLALQTTTGRLPLDPLRAAQIDRKADDGLPSTGFIQAYGVSASCFCNTTTTPQCPQAAAGSWVYDERVRSKDCGLIYRITY
ncbi:MAG: type II secretion system protein [Alphaproteobacteria bacterium]